MAYSFIRHILKVLKELADDGGIDKGALQNIADNQQVSQGNLLARERLKEMGFDVDTPQYTGFVGEEELDELSTLDARTWFSDDPSVASEYVIGSSGPRLTQKQWDDLHKSAKKRSNWKDARRAWYKKTKSDIEELRSQRKQPNRDPLGGVLTGSERIKRKLQKQRYERGASELLDKYGLGGDSHSKYIVSSSGRTQSDFAGLEEALDKRRRLLERLESVRGVSGNDLWNKTNAAEVNVGLNYLLKHGDSVRDVPTHLHGAITRANLEAVPRALKKEGWTVRHASTHRGSGRRSSRYLVSPHDDYEIRLTDHYLPETWARQMQHKYTGARRWDDELVIDEHDVSPLEIIETIKKRYKEHKEDAGYRTQMFTVPPAAAAGAGALGALLDEGNGI